MKPEDLKERIPEGEFEFSSSRSSGPGGQNVNKVNTKVEVRLNIILSSYLSEDEKKLICSKLGNKINSQGELIVTSQSERSQLLNREKALERILKLLCSALTEKPVRKSTVPTTKSKMERLEEKKKRGLIKKMRRDSDQTGQE